MANGRETGRLSRLAGIKVVEDGFICRGHIYRVGLRRGVVGTIKMGSFSQDARGHWYINVCVDMADTQFRGQGQLGIDLGLKTTATMSDGQKYDGLRAYLVVEASLGKAQRAHKKNGSKPYMPKQKTAV